MRGFITAIVILAIVGSCAVTSAFWVKGVFREATEMIDASESKRGGDVLRDVGDYIEGKTALRFFFRESEIDGLVAALYRAAAHKDNANGAEYFAAIKDVKLKLAEMTADFTP